MCSSSFRQEGLKLLPDAVLEQPLKTNNYNKMKVGVRYYILTLPELDMLEQ